MNTHDKKEASSEQTFFNLLKRYQYAHLDELVKQAALLKVVHDSANQATLDIDESEKNNLLDQYKKSLAAAHAFLLEKVPPQESKGVTPKR